MNAGGRLRETATRGRAAVLGGTAGGAPVVNVLFSMYLHPPKVAPNPLLWVGMVLVAIGASLVLYFKPQG